MAPHTKKNPKTNKQTKTRMMENMLRQRLPGYKIMDIRNDLERMQHFGNQIRKTVKYISCMKMFWEEIKWLDWENRNEESIVNYLDKPKKNQSKIFRVF